MTSLARLNATIPKPLSEFADRRVKSGNFGNKSEYLRHLIRQDMESARQNDIDYLNRILRESEASGLSDETPDEIRAAMKKIVKKAVADRKK